jgi:hypothetical protein
VYVCLTLLPSVRNSPTSISRQEHKRNLICGLPDVIKPVVMFRGNLRFIVRPKTNGSLFYFGYVTDTQK